MPADLEVDADALRACAAALATTADDVRGASPPPPVHAPGWATSEAVSALVAAASRELATIGAAIADTGRQVIAATTAYEAADDRAAARLRAGR